MKLMYLFAVTFTKTRKSFSACKVSSFASMIRCAARPVTSILILFGCLFAGQLQAQLPGGGGVPPFEIDDPRFDIPPILGPELVLPIPEELLSIGSREMELMNQRSECIDFESFSAGTVFRLEDELVENGGVLRIHRFSAGRIPIRVFELFRNQ